MTGKAKDGAQVHYKRAKSKAPDGSLMLLIDPESPDVQSNEHGKFTPVTLPDGTEARWTGRRLYVDGDSDVDGVMFRIVAESVTTPEAEASGGNGETAMDTARTLHAGGSRREAKTVLCTLDGIGPATADTILDSWD